MIVQPAQSKAPGPTTTTTMVVMIRSILYLILEKRGSSRSSMFNLDRAKPLGQLPAKGTSWFLRLQSMMVVSWSDTFDIGKNVEDLMYW